MRSAATCMKQYQNQTSLDERTIIAMSIRKPETSAPAIPAFKEMKFKLIRACRKSPVTQKPSALSPKRSTVDTLKDQTLDSSVSNCKIDARSNCISKQSVGHRSLSLSLNISKLLGDVDKIEDQEMEAFKPLVSIDSSSFPSSYSFGPSYSSKKRTLGLSKITIGRSNSVSISIRSNKTIGKERQISAAPDTQSKANERDASTMGANLRDNSKIGFFCKSKNPFKRDNLRNASSQNPFFS